MSENKRLEELIKKYVEHTASKEEMIELRDMINEELKEGTDPVTALKISFMKPVLDHNIRHYR